jgi:hypothetical protein
MQLKRSTAILLSIILASSVLACAGSTASTQPDAPETIVYLKNNIHGTERYKGDTRTLRASYANYVGDYQYHAMIPVNTPVTIDKVKSSGIYMTSEADGTKITFEYRATNMGGLSAEEYVGYITAPSKVSLNQFSPIDKKGIADGKAYKGMSKDGVRMALGYPALHKTASLQENVWTYWRNRFATTAVEFDSRGKVKAVR